MSRRVVKRQVLEILRLNRLAEIDLRLRAFNNKELINPLFSALCNADEVVRWHAISAFGQIVPRIGDDDLERARIIMRRFLWSLNDESGGIGWGAPEAMAEIMAVDDRMADEYLHMLISYMRDDGPELFQDGNYLELPMLQRGLLWGVGRLCAARKDVMAAKGVADDLYGYLSSQDHVVRTLGVWCLSLLAADLGREEVVRLAHDRRVISIYMGGHFEELCIADLIRLHVAKQNTPVY